MALIEKAKNWIVRHNLSRCRFRELLLLFLICGLGVACIVTLHDAKAAKDKRMQMKAAVSAYSDQVRMVNTAPYRAVGTEQVSEVRQDLVGKAKDYGLKVEADNEPLYRDGTGEVYEMKLKGSWQRTAGFLERLQSKDALLGLRMVQMKGTENQLETCLQVKVYTKQVM